MASCHINFRPRDPASIQRTIRCVDEIREIKSGGNVSGMMPSDWRNSIVRPVPIRVRPCTTRAIILRDLGPAANRCEPTSRRRKHEPDFHVFPALGPIAIGATNSTEHKNTCASPDQSSGNSQGTGRFWPKGGLDRPLRVVPARLRSVGSPQPDGCFKATQPLGNLKRDSGSLSRQLRRSGERMHALAEGPGRCAVQPYFSFKE